VIVYADTSALAKLVVAEAQTRSLRAWLARRRSTPLVTNVVGVVELRRLAARVSTAAVPAAELLLSRIDQLQLTSAALELAARLTPPGVRTLDALHVGSAAELADLEAVLTYDRRMADACIALGLPVAAPGRR